MAEDLKVAWNEARAAWPGVNVTEEELAAYVSDRMDGSSADEASPLRTTDLYLACACARGDAVALQAFERAFFPEIDHALQKIRSPSIPARDEIAQLVRFKLFVPEADRRPKIADYSGRGQLRGWFRVTVTRLLMNLATRSGPEVPFEDELLGHLLGGTRDPELEHAKSELQAEFRVAFEEGLRALDPRDRTLLRYAFGEELTVQAIGTLLGVHKTTAARWVVRAHHALLDGVKARLVARLGIRDDDYASVLRAVRSRLELSLERYLKECA